MGITNALAIVIGAMGGLATGLAVQVASPYYVIWVVFVAWASFYAAGGGTEGLKKSVPANIWGAVIAAISLWAFGHLATSMNVSIAAALCVGVAIVVLIMGARIPQLGFIPGQVFGYAPTAGLYVTSLALYDLSVVKMLVAAVVSLVLGNVLGLISERIGSKVATA